MTSLLYLGYFQKDLLHALQQTEAYFPMESVIEKNSITKSHKIPELILAANYKQVEHDSVCNFMFNTNQRMASTRD